jgi:hypothetical protein
MSIEKRERRTCAYTAALCVGIVATCAAVDAAQPGGNPLLEVSSDEPARPARLTLTGDNVPVRPSREVPVRLSREAPQGGAVLHSADAPHEPLPVGPGCLGNETLPEMAIEFSCGQPVDTVNGGCNSIPPVFLPVSCGDTICGTSYFDGSIRDTDWFYLPGVTGTQVTWRGTALFESLVAIVEDDNCVNVSLCAFQLSPPGPFCVTCVPQLQGLRVSLFIAPQFTTVFPCGLEYHGEVVCQPCNASVTVFESALEPACGQPVDTVNGGCNSPTPVFIAVTCGDVICGSYQYNGTVRDTDWFSFHVTEPGLVTWTGEFEDPGVLIILDANPLNCPSPNILAFAFPDACAPATAQVNLTCGDYVAFAAPLFVGAPPCGRNYRAQIEYPRIGQTTLGRLLGGFGRCIGQPGYDPCADLNGDGCIDQSDLGILLQRWGQC